MAYITTEADTLNGTAATCPVLLSGEQRELAHFILQAPETRRYILAEAQRNPATSGPLILAYRWAMTA